MKRTNLIDNFSLCKSSSSASKPGNIIIVMHFA